ncbi:DUF6069 family protein [Longispora fulva]|uniref:Uncharacterized protein n=1 Tax=Longispora fulva TaxID=619741 RepID=A0A8J7G8G7_9ACTN|nr:DUF6069 family protein [Longispora fulva]MBG6135633.1 hypothetical protein [Longispora fulva]
MTDTRFPQSRRDVLCRRTTRLGVVLGATVSALISWTSLHRLAGIDLAVGRGDAVRHVGAGSVVLATLVAGLAAWAALAVLERTTGHARRVWTVLALAVLVVSLLGPLGGATGSAQVGLAALHLTVGAILILALPRTHRQCWR